MHWKLLIMAILTVTLSGVVLAEGGVISKRTCEAGTCTTTLYGREYDIDGSGEIIPASAPLHLDRNEDDIIIQYDNKGDAKIVVLESGVVLSNGTYYPMSEVKQNFPEINFYFPTYKTPTELKYAVNITDLPIWLVQNVEYVTLSYKDHYGFTLDQLVMHSGIVIAEILELGFDDLRTTGFTLTLNKSEKRVYIGNLGAGYEASTSSMFLDPTVGVSSGTLCGKNDTYIDDDVLINGTVSVCDYDGSPTNCDGGASSGCGYVEFYAANLNITSAGTLNLNYTGYRGDTDTGGSGEGEGGGVSSNGVSENGGGAGYGGAGGNGQDGGTGGPAYASTTNVTHLGSGGGAANRANADGGDGGGYALLNISGGTFILDGMLTANGEDGTLDLIESGGGGSGGGIHIFAKTITGEGNMTVTGGSSIDSSWDSGGGGGGRILVQYQTNSSFSPFVSVAGGKGYSGTDGAAGSLTYDGTLSFNSAPTFTTSINATAGTNKSDENLTCFATLTDTDGDTLNVTVKWFENDELNLTVTYNNDYASGTLVNYTLGSGNTTFDDEWICELNVSDGSDDVYSNSTILTVFVANYSVSMVYPNSSSPVNVNASVNLTLTFDFLRDQISTVSGLALLNVSFGGYNATILQTNTCTGTLDCSQYASEAACENCSQCDWAAAVPAPNYNDTVSNLNAYLRIPFDDAYADILGNQGSAIDTQVGTITYTDFNIPNPPTTQWAFFDGTDGLDSSGDNTNINSYTTPAGDYFAISVWFNASIINDTNNGQLLWGQGGGTNSLTVYASSDLGYDAIFCTAVEGSNIDYVSHQIEEDRIYHLGCIWDFAGGNITMWVNGTEVDSDTALAIGSDLASHVGDVSVANPDDDDDDHDGLAITGYWYGNIGDLVYWGVGQDGAVNGTNFTKIYDNGMTGAEAAQCGATGGGACSSCAISDCNTNCSDAGCNITPVDQFAHNSEYWEVNVTVGPTELTSTQDVFVQTNYTSDNAVTNHTESDAVDYGTSDCDCPSEGSNWEISAGSDCELSAACNIGSGILRVYGSLVIPSGYFMRAAGCYKDDAATTFYVEDGGGLYCGS